MNLRWENLQLEVLKRLYRLGRGTPNYHYTFNPKIDLIGLGAKVILSPEEAFVYLASSS